MMLTQERLKKLLHYDPETGVFTRLVSTSNCVHVGDVAGHLNNEGYVQIRVDNKRFLAHRLAFLYMTGVWPTECVDHISRDKADNRWTNLRQCTTAQNNCNRSKQSNNTSGIKGVCRSGKTGKWRVQCYIAGKNHYLGTFDDLELAKQTAIAARAKYHGDFAS